MSAPSLVVTGLYKSFGAVQALRGASLSVVRGEIHGLVGENGAGKSTLIKVLSGVLSQDSGGVEIEGIVLDTGSVARSEAAGICAVHQESTAFRDLGLAENLFVGHEPTRLFGLLLDHRAMKRKARDWMASIGQDSVFSGPLSARSIAQQQLVAIARAIASECRVLILDEPTASLSVREVEVLKKVVKDLAGKGVSVLYVSHRLDEIFDLCDQVTVMRDGVTVETRKVSETTRDELIKAMVGREINETVASSKAVGGERLVVEGLTLRGGFEDVSFVVHEGEILGLGGLVGSGRSEVANAVFGASKADRGTIVVDGRQLKGGSIEESIRARIAFVPEDRQHQGLVLELSVLENIVMTLRKRLARFGFVSKRKERVVVDGTTKDLSIKASSPHVLASTLSGGNQQKVVLGKWLATSPTVLIVDEPTRGVDVGSKSEIHSILRTRAEQGAAILLISSDLPELLALSDRIVVLRGGRVSGTLTREQATQESVLTLALTEGWE